MSVFAGIKDPIIRRLAPLYLAAFLQGFVLWYAIEKLFMTDIGFTDATIGVMVAAYSMMMLLFETPSGILADRWSRKGVLIIASVALAVSSFICGASNSVEIYILGAVFWGIFYALYTGTYDSIIYDTLLEEKKSGDLFEKYYGKLRVAESLSWVVGALLGGVLAELFGLRGTFFLSVPISLLAVAALVAFKEPLLHKANQIPTIKAQIVGTLKSVAHKGILRYTLVALVGIFLITEILYEFNQLWLIALAAPIVLYGPANALLYAAEGLAGLLAPRLRLQRARILLPLLVAVAVLVVCLIFTRDVFIIVAAQVLLAILLLAVDIIFVGNMHAQLPSNVRAGAASAVSTFGRVLLIPASLLFGWISARHDIFAASWVLLGLLVIIAPIITKAGRSSRNMQVPVVPSGGYKR